MNVQRDERNFWILAIVGLITGILMFFVSHALLMLINTICIAGIFYYNGKSRGRSETIREALKIRDS